MYKIAQGSSTIELESQVNVLLGLNEGWELSGSMIVVSDPTRGNVLKYLQPMYKSLT